MISIYDLVYEYENKVRALDGVSLEIADNEFVALMGENGAGKTTLVKHLNGLLKPTKGKVIVNGYDTRKHSVAELSQFVGLVFQNADHQLFAETVFKEVAFGLQKRKLDKDLIEEKVSRILEKLRIDHLANRSPFSLSGGERKRVALASILVMEPEILVLDEPTIGQDQRQKERLKEIIDSLLKDGKTIVMITHDVEFAVDYIPRTIAMKDGKIVADGDTKKVLTNDYVLENTALLPPQINQVVKYLRQWYDISQDVATIDDMIKIIMGGE